MQAPRSDIFKHLALAALIALLVYVASFWTIESRRTRNGPWEVQFIAGDHGEVTLVINQARVGVSQVRLEFPDHKLPAPQFQQTLRFEKPREVPFDLPFGRCIYQDLTFLPGVVTFDFFGHEIELMRRTIVVDKREVAWASGETIRVTGEGVSPKPATAR